MTDASLALAAGTSRISGRPVRSVGVRGDGDRVAAAFDGGTVRVLIIDRHESAAEAELDTRSRRRPWPRSADGSRVASAGADGTVRLWTLADGSTDTLHRGRRPDVGRRVQRGRQVGSWRRATMASSARWNAPTRSRGGHATSGGGSAVHGGVQPRRSPVRRRWRERGRHRLGGRRRTARDLARPAAVGLRRQLRPDERCGRQRLEDGTVRLWDAGRTQPWKVPETDGRRLQPRRTARRPASDAAAPRLGPDQRPARRTAFVGPGDGITSAFSPVADEVLIADANSRTCGPGRSTRTPAKLVFRAPGARAWARRGSTRAAADGVRGRSRTGSPSVH